MTSNPLSLFRLLDAPVIAEVPRLTSEKFGSKQNFSLWLEQEIDISIPEQLSEPYTQMCSSLMTVFSANLLTIVEDTLCKLRRLNSAIRIGCAPDNTVIDERIASEILLSADCDINAAIADIVPTQPGQGVPHLRVAIITEDQASAEARDVFRIATSRRLNALGYFSIFCPPGTHETDRLYELRLVLLSVAGLPLVKGLVCIDLADVVWILNPTLAAYGVVHHLDLDKVLRDELATDDLQVAEAGLFGMIWTNDEFTLDSLEVIYEALTRNVDDKADIKIACSTSANKIAVKHMISLIATQRWPSG